MKITNFLTLPDGRRLAYAEYGDPNGHPVLYFHGAPSSRLEPLILGDEAIAQSGLRVIAPDRPGVGQSDFQPNRGFSDWVSDVDDHQSACEWIRTHALFESEKIESDRM